MKRFLFGIILVLFGGVFVSANAQATGRGATSIMFELKAGQTRNIPGSKATIKFLNVMEDSRCPEGTNCIWAGNAKLRFRATEGRRSRIFDLNSSGDGDSYLFAGYQIRFLKLSAKGKENSPGRHGYVVTLTAIPSRPTGRG